MEGSIDYSAAGLRVGLEVHQQLLTAQKMFCRCPAGCYTESHDGVMLRHMRPTLSELGEYDGTALMEFKTRKNIIYLLHEANACTYEMDDTPPFLVNTEALDIAIQQCLMLGCDIVDEVHIARKQYLDGSIPTGFQRTAIVGVNGRFPFRGRDISVIQVSVEEDSCREVLDRGHLIVWRADRLGMPLIETVTGPELRSPDEVEEAILLIGRVCRSTGKVRTGIGASRQDVNVSVRGGRRVEIKGVSQAWRARQLVHGEAVRQIELLRLRDDLHRRGLRRSEDIAMEHRDVTRLFAESSFDLLRREAWERLVEEENRRPGLELGEGPFCVRAVRLAGLAGTLTRPCQPGLTFAHEVAGRVRVVATLDQAPILLHGEDWPEYSGGDRDLDRLRRETGCGSDDALLVVWGAERDTVTAAEEIRLRYVDALDGVPHETRQPLPDGSTDFERILPGPDRMYPDTDSPAQEVTRERVSRLAVGLPEPPWVREERYLALGISRQTAHYLIRRTPVGARLVDLVVADCGADPRRACFFFGEELKGLRRAGIGVDEVPDESWRELFTAVGARPALWEVRRLLVELMASDPGVPLGDLLAGAGLERQSDGWRQDLAGVISRLLQRCAVPGAEACRRFLMGFAMSRLRGRVPAAEVAAELDRILAGKAATGDPSAAPPGPGDRDAG